MNYIWVDDVCLGPRIRTSTRLSLVSITHDPSTLMRSAALRCFALNSSFCFIEGHHAVAKWEKHDLPKLLTGSGFQMFFLLIGISFV